MTTTTKITKIVAGWPSPPLRRMIRTASPTSGLLKSPSSAAIRRISIRVWAIALAALWLAAPAHADRDALWSLVHGQCVPHQQAGEVPPKPCDEVDLTAGEDKGVALLKDRVGVAQMLAIPTRRVTGIEDPFLLSPDAPNYFATAWTEGRARFEFLSEGLAAARTGGRHCQLVVRPHPGPASSTRLLPPAGRRAGARCLRALVRCDFAAHDG